MDWNFVTIASLALLAVVGTWLDVAQRRLPNWLCLVTAAAGLLLTGLQSGVSEAGYGILHGILALAIGMLLFRLGWVGGGDAKFYPAIAIWFNISEAANLAFAIGLSGLVLVLGWFGWRQFWRNDKPTGARKFGSVPYGVAIGVGAVAAKVAIL